MRINKNELARGNLKNAMSKLYQLFDGYEAFVVIIQSDWGKFFGYFIPCKFQ